MQVRIFAAICGGNHTEFIYAEFSNNINLIITQYNKLGNLHSVNIDQPVNGTCPSLEPVYSITNLLGNGDIQVDVAVRYLAEKLRIKKSLFVSLTLKDHSKDTLNTIIKALQQALSKP